MGTHPIFESDFDCLTDLIKSAIMAKRTKKVGICGKYGTRYGATLRKIIKKMEVSQHKRWVNPYTGTQTLKRHSTGIWACKKSGVKIAGGAYVFETTSLKMMRRGIARQREAMQQ